MKRIVFALLMLVSISLMDLHAQLFYYVIPNTAVAGQVVTINVGDPLMNCFAVYNGCALHRNGTYIHASSWHFSSGSSFSATFSIPLNAQSGAWDLQLLSNPFPLFYGAVTITGSQPGNYGSISGKAYFDTNQNCQFNTLEPQLAGRVIEITPGPYYAMTNGSGNYLVSLPVGDYTLSNVPRLHEVSFCPSTGQHLDTLSTNGQAILNENFALDFVPYSEVQIGEGGDQLAPGFTALRHLNVIKSGTLPTSSAVVRLVKPAFTSFVSFSTAPQSINGDTATWTFTNVSTNIPLNYSLLCPANTPINTPYSITSSVEPSPMDFDPTNNARTRSFVVAGAYDPNDKQVFTVGGQNADGDVVAGDSLLTYMIRFQNTGTAPAVNVYVRDSLDVAHLDLSTLRILHTSHTCVTTMGRNGELEFSLPSIQLPDSHTNQALSHGYILYEVEQKPGLALGTVIPNSASIYFDYNAPVKTNTTHTRLCDVHAAGFSVAATGLSVQFTDQSVGSVQTRQWDFGDGNTSTAASPTHTYLIPGNYAVCLITNGVCKSDTACMTLNVCSTAPVAGFSSTTNGLNATFVDNSTNGSGYEWDFGDGGTSTVASPTHTFAGNGTYNVCLVTTSSCGLRDTVCATVTVCMVPTATMGSQSLGAGLIQFQDSSLGAIAWVWDFGDGNTATTQHPIHQYANDGNYTVCLITQSGCAADTICSTIAVCGVPVVAAFSSNPSGLTAAFTNASTNGQSYLWDFGDGGTSTAQAPVHTYAGVGTYQVCLTVTSACGNTQTHCANVAVCMPPVASMSFTQPVPGTLDFLSTGAHASSWLWDFGDGSTSTQANPSHGYTANGIYQVCLIVYNSCGSDAYCTNVVVCPQAPQAGFSTVANQNQLTFTDNSIGAVGYYWDFGDGNVSNLTSPTHAYAAAGTYVVSHTVTSICNTTDTHDTTVTVCFSPLAAWTYSPVGLGTLSFTDASQNANSWFWTFGDGASSSTQHPTHTYLANGLYPICLIATNACGESSTFCDTVAVQAVGVAQAMPGFEIRFWPNPVHDQAYLLVESAGASGELDLELYDVQGACVHRQKGAIHQRMTVERGGLAGGMYIFRVTQEGVQIGVGRMVVD